MKSRKLCSEPDIPTRLATGSTEAQGLDALAQVEFFTPDANWTWYASEFDGDDFNSLLVRRLRDA